SSAAIKSPQEESGATEGDASHDESGCDPGAIATEDGCVADGDGTVHLHSVEAAAPGPNPIVPEVKEVLWGAGAFIVLAVIMRYVAFPKLKKGMDARYASIRAGHEQADALRATATAEVADYQAQLAAVKAEAAGRVDTARHNLEAKRSERIAAVNAEIAELRAAAAAENDASRLAVRDQIQAAVADVSASAIRIAVGKAPDAAVVDRVVADVMNTGASA
ncbi:MAG TPA: ATP synthase F0 subunit B, partial [Ilumatobacteraceae bacterium]|nr:ATP synthase F0 subunit B [Ilumatobacteraceae bacterium]